MSMRVFEYDPIDALLDAVLECKTASLEDGKIRISVDRVTAKALVKDFQSRSIVGKA